jgi:hypothetical protein
MQDFPFLQNFLSLPEDSPQLRYRRPRQRGIHFEGSKIASLIVKQINNYNIWILALSNKSATVTSDFSQDTEDIDPLSFLVSKR